MNESTDKPNDFVMQVIASQDQVFAYILSLTADRQQAHDVMQDVNCVLLEKSDSYQAGTNFLAWAKKIAHYQLLAQRRDYARDRLVLSDELLGLVQASHDDETASTEDQRNALRQCLGELPEEARQLIRERYYADRRVRDLASLQNVLPNVVTKRLSRLRVMLKDCIERRLSGGLTG